ncbi:MAG TPA: serine hydrolase [Ktedonobacterales bacterium]|nr:serine hydrolase [Ktedonobacterales bacterium]
MTANDQNLNNQPDNQVEGEITEEGHEEGHEDTTLSGSDQPQEPIATPIDLTPPATQAEPDTVATWDRPTQPRLSAITRKLPPLTVPLSLSAPDATAMTDALTPDDPLLAGADGAASASTQPDGAFSEADARVEGADEQDTLKLPALSSTQGATEAAGATSDGDASIPGDLFLLPPFRVAQMRRELAAKPHASVWRAPILMGAIIILVAVPLLFVVSRLASSELASRGAGHTPTPHAITATPDTPAEWARDAQRTPLNPQDAVFSRQRYAVAPAFQAYYTHRNGPTWLGVALTPAFATAEGLAQFFTDGALLLPGRLDADDSPGGSPTTPGITSAAGMATGDEDTTSSAPGDINPQLVRDGVYDTATGVEWLPLAHSLLAVGSEALVANGESVGEGMTYLTLRAATDPAALAPAPPGSQAASTPTTTTPTTTATPATTANATASATASATATTATPSATVTPTTTLPVFVAEGTHDGQTVGHTIPAAIWDAINDVSVSPDGWQVDFGAPLTEAIPLTTTTPDGQTHHLLAQMFWEGALIFDQDDYAANPTQGAAAAVTPLALGQAYLQTLGAPTPAAPQGQQIWAIGDMAILATPMATGQAEVHIGQNFPLTITGGQWRQGALWYSVAWRSLRRNGDGWAAATALTLTPPGLNAPMWASFDALSPALAAYLTGEGANVGAVVYDLTRNTYYTYNGQSEFTMASSAKVSLMAEDLAGDEAQGSSPSPGDLATLTAMIEQSDNGAAQSIYETHSYDYGVYTYLQSVGITDYVRNPNGWGFGEWSPLSMARLLTMLQTGQLLNASDTALALSLMSNIEPDQQNGVGDTAPNGATYAMKDGWTPAEDGLWAVNSSGIVTVGKETYIIAVYSQEQESLDGGWDITRQVCGPVGKLLT